MIKKNKNGKKSGGLLFPKLSMLCKKIRKCFYRKVQCPEPIVTINSEKALIEAATKQPDFKWLGDIIWVDHVAKNLGSISGVTEST